MPFPSGLHTQLHQVPVWIQAREAEYSASLVFTTAAAVWHKQVTCLPVGSSDGKLPCAVGRVRVRGNVCGCPCPWECLRICAQCPRVCLSADVAPVSVDVWIFMLRCSETLLGVVVVEKRIRMGRVGSGVAVSACPPTSACVNKCLSKETDATGPLLELCCLLSRKVKPSQGVRFRHYSAPCCFRLPLLRSIVVRSCCELCCRGCWCFCALSTMMVGPGIVVHDLPVARLLLRRSMFGFEIVNRSRSKASSARLPSCTTASHS